MHLDLHYLNRVRILRGYTVAEVARRAKRPYERIQKVFVGASKGPDTVKAICDALGISTEDVWKDGEQREAERGLR